ncbi:MAG: hypothetical protein ABR923_14120 [Terracidiphilus sp.]|jgi:hypothetical protein
MAIQGTKGELRMVTKKPRVKPVKRARKDGAEELRRAADRVILRDSKRLAKLLGEKAIQGDLNSVKMLVGLAEKKKPEPETGKRHALFDFIKDMAAQPVWEWFDDSIPKTKEELAAEEERKRGHGRWVLKQRTGNRDEEDEDEGDED